MFKKLLLINLLAAISVASMAQNNEWKEYFANENISIQFLYTECHQPAKGLHHENVLLRLENNTDQDVIISYNVIPVYNGKELKGDTNAFTFTVPAHYKMESTCDDLKDGLYIFSKMLDLKPASVLNSFELKNLIINGKTIAR